MRYRSFPAMAVFYGTLCSVPGFAAQASPSGQEAASPLVLRPSSELSSYARSRPQPDSAPGLQAVPATDGAASDALSGEAVPDGGTSYNSAAGSVLAAPSAVSPVSSSSSLSSLSPVSSAYSIPARALTALLVRVLPNDPQVQGAQAVLASAQARYRQARSRLFPSLGLQANHGRSSDLEGRFSVERHTRQVEANLRWNLYRGGADHGDMAASTLEVAAAEAELRRAREEVAERLAEAYFDLLRLARTRDSAALRLNEVTQLVAQVARQSAEGKLSELDLQQAQTAELDAELTHQALESDYQSALIRLRLQAGGQLSEDITDFNFERAAPADTGQNAALRAAQARASAASLRVRNLAETLAPRIDLDVRHLLNNRTTPPPSTLQQHGWSIGVSWEWPLGGENLARRDEFMARRLQAEAEVGRVEMGARVESEALNLRIANLRRSLANLAGQEQKMVQIMRGSAIQFEAGRRSLQQIIQSHDNFFALQQRQQEHHHRLRLAEMRQWALSGQLLVGLGLLP